MGKPDQGSAAAGEPSWSSRAGGSLEAFSPRAVADPWEDFLDRYSAYRALPVWGTMVRVPDARGRLKRADVKAIAARGARATERTSRPIPSRLPPLPLSWPEQDALRL